MLGEWFVPFCCHMSYLNCLPCTERSFPIRHKMTAAGPSSQQTADPYSRISRRPQTKQIQRQGQRRAADEKTSWLYTLEPAAELGCRFSRSRHLRYNYKFIKPYMIVKSDEGGGMASCHFVRFAEAPPP
jgi:hypothetical protein